MADQFHGIDPRRDLALRWPRDPAILGPEAGSDFFPASGNAGHKSSFRAGEGTLDQLALEKFIGGEPMKPATNRFAGSS